MIDRIRPFKNEIRHFIKVMLMLWWAMLRSLWLHYSPDAAANLLCEGILQRAGAVPETNFVFGLKKHALRDNMLPDEFLYNCNDSAKAQFYCCCRLFVWACMSLGMDSSFRLHLSCGKAPALPLITCITWQQRIVMSACIKHTVPNAVVAYICDRDGVLMDFWQRTNADAKDQWLIVVDDVGIGMTHGGVQVKLLREWARYLVEERRKALRSGTTTYDGPTRTGKFYQHAFEMARVDALQVCWMTLAGTRTPP